MVHVDDDDDTPSGDGVSPTVLGAGAEEIDVQNLDEETQRFVMETHMENLGLYDFLGFDLASLATESSTYHNAPDVNVGGGGGRHFDKLGDGMTFVTLIKAFMGVGILTMPYAIMQGGLVLGPVGLLLICFVEWYCIELLLETSRILNVRTGSYGGLGMRICGRWAKVVVNASIIITQFSGGVAYVIFISENVAAVVCHETHAAACPRVGAVAVGMLLWVLPFSLLRSLNVLAVPMLMGNFAILGVVGWGFFCVADGLTTEGPAHDALAMNWAGLPVLFGCVVWAFEGIGVIMPIQASMQNPSHLPKLLRIAMVFLGSLYALFGTVCYSLYGLTTNAMVTFNIPQGKITSFLRLFYCLAISFTYPVMIFPIHQLVEQRYRRLKTDAGRRVLVRSCTVFLSGAIAMQVPHFGLFVGLVGSIACSLLAFVMPAVFHLKTVHADAAPGAGRKDVAIIVGGCVAGLLSFSLTLKELIDVVVSGESDGGEGGHR